MEYAIRFNVKPGKMHEFIEWSRKNDETARAHQPPGWTYLTTLITVRGFGSYEAETRWQLDDYSALGAGFGDETLDGLNRQWFEEFYDDRFPMEVSLKKGIEDVVAGEGA